MVSRNSAIAAGMAVAMVPAGAAAAQANERGSDQNVRTIRMDDAGSPSNMQEALRLIDAQRTTLNFDVNGRALPADRSRRLASAATTEADGPVARAACGPLCIIIVTRGAQLAASAAAGSRVAPKVVQRAATRAAVRTRLGPARDFPGINFRAVNSQGKLRIQAKFKHAKGFADEALVGKEGAQKLLLPLDRLGPQGHALFEQAIRAHMLSSTHRMFGSISGVRGPVVHYYNQWTKRVATFKSNGDFITAQKLSDERATQLFVWGHLGNRLPF